MSVQQGPSGRIGTGRLGGRHRWEGRAWCGSLGGPPSAAASTAGPSGPRVPDVASGVPQSCSVGVIEPTCTPLAAARSMSSWYSSGDTFRVRDRKNPLVPVGSLTIAHW